MAREAEVNCLRLFDPSLSLQSAESDEMIDTLVTLQTYKFQLPLATTVLHPEDSLLFLLLSILLGRWP